MIDMRNEIGEWSTLGDLPPGMVFITLDGTLGVKSAYRNILRGQQCLCVLLGSGEYADFSDGDDTLVKALEVDADQSSTVVSMLRRILENKGATVDIDTGASVRVIVGWPDEPQPALLEVA